MEYKAIKISKEAYDKLAELKKKMAVNAKKKGDMETLGMLAAMGLGAFAGWLIYKMERELPHSG